MINSSKNNSWILSHINSMKKKAKKTTNSGENKNAKSKNKYQYGLKPTQPKRKPKSPYNINQNTIRERLLRQTVRPNLLSVIPKNSPFFLKYAKRNTHANKYEIGFRNLKNTPNKKPQTNNIHNRTRKAKLIRNGVGLNPFKGLKYRAKPKRGVKRKRSNANK